MADLPSAVYAQGVIAVCRGVTGTRARALAEILLSDGISVIEVTMEARGAESAIGAASDLPGITVGAGTVLSVTDANRAVDAGASFLVSPGLDEEILRWAQGSGVPYLPGVLTPTEVATARRFGVKAMKLFPASLGGPTYLSALLGPFPDVRFIPTGGLEAKDARAFLEAGAAAIGVGGWLTSHDDLAIVSKRARGLLEALGRGEG